MKFQEPRNHLPGWRLPVKFVAHSRRRLPGFAVLFFQSNIPGLFPDRFERCVLLYRIAPEGLAGFLGSQIQGFLEQIHGSAAVAAC
jgi:hypothetical protein